jgi:uncharacterized phage protein (TIGR02220 family)
MPKIKGGYYLKARKIQESKIAHMPPHFREIWDWLIKEANHKDKKYCGFIVKRGQLFRTYQDIREGLHWMVGYRKMMYNENHTKKAMKFLRENRMITTSKELGGVLITIINYDEYQNPKNYERTDEEPNERTNEEPMKNHPIPDNNKNEKNVKNVNNKEVVKNIVEYLNQKTGKSFKHSSKETQKLIKARLNSGFTEKDFLTVIDNKVSKWFCDPKMVEYLRPQTLFGTKFESYLQDKPHPLHGKVSETTMKNINVLENWEPKDER